MTLKKQSRPIIRPFGKLYYLINHEYRLLQKQILIICLLEFVIGQVLFIATLAPYNREEKLLFAPFEQIVAQSGQSLLTIISVGFALLFIGLGVHQQFTPGRSIYRLYQLESSPAILYGAKLIAAATGLMLVLLTQLVSAIAAWFLYYQSAAADLIPGSLQLAFLPGRSADFGGRMGRQFGSGTAQARPVCLFWSGAHGSRLAGDSRFAAHGLW